MAVVQDYIGWPTNVNRIILDSTSITVGENALKTDELESGHKRSIQKSAFCPDKFSIKMEFDWVNKVSGTNKTEYQLFLDWYKYKHKYGSVPFEFPEILYSNESGIWITDYEAGTNYAVEYYKITSAVTGAKSGDCVSVEMTWESVYGGTLSITTPLPSVVGVDAYRTYVDVLFSSVSDTAPVAQNFTTYVNSVQITPAGFYYDNQLTARIYYEEVAQGTTRVDINYAGYTGSFTSSF